MVSGLGKLEFEPVTNYQSLGDLPVPAVLSGSEHDIMRKAIIEALKMVLESSESSDFAFALKRKIMRLQLEGIENAPTE